MKTIKLNETPVRTAKNYQINNINIENFEFPKNIEKFKNILHNLYPHSDNTF